MNRAPRSRQRTEIREVLDDVHTRAQQQRVRGPLTAGFRVVDVDRVDPDQHGTRVDQVLRAVSGEKRCARTVFGRSEVAVPSGVQQHGGAAHVPAGKSPGADSAVAWRPRHR